MNKRIYQNMFGLIPFGFFLLSQNLFCSGVQAQTINELRDFSDIVEMYVSPTPSHLLVGDENPVVMNNVASNSSANLTLKGVSRTSPSLTVTLNAKFENGVWTISAPVYTGSLPVGMTKPLFLLEDTGAIAETAARDAHYIAVQVDSGTPYVIQWNISGQATEHVRPVLLPRFIARPWIGYKRGWAIKIRNQFPTGGFDPFAVPYGPENQNLTRMIEATKYGLQLQSNEQVSMDYEIKEAYYSDQIIDVRNTNIMRAVLNGWTVTIDNRGNFFDWATFSYYQPMIDQLMEHTPVLIPQGTSVYYSAGNWYPDILFDPNVDVLDMAFMHELGHTLQWSHTGAVVNCDDRNSQNVLPHQIYDSAFNSHCSKDRTYSDVMSGQNMWIHPVQRAAVCWLKGLQVKLIATNGTYEVLSDNDDFSSDSTRPLILQIPVQIYDFDDLLYVSLLNTYVSSTAHIAEGLELSGGRIDRVQERDMRNGISRMARELQAYAYGSDSFTRMIPRGKDVRLLWTGTDVRIKNLDHKGQKALVGVQFKGEPLPVGSPMLLQPSNLTVDTDTQAKLAWNDDSAMELEYSIERRKDSESNFQEIGRVEMDQMLYVDATYDPAMKYHYRVRAYNAQGYSNYSNVFSTGVTFKLRLNVQGNGQSGFVNLSPAGNSCTGDVQYPFCYEYPQNTQITLSPNSTLSASRFVGWSLAQCPGTGSCVVNLDQSVIGVTATFAVASEMLSPSNGQQLNATTLDLQLSAGDRINERKVRLSTINAPSQAIFDQSIGTSDKVSIGGLPQTGEQLLIQISSKSSDTSQFLTPMEYQLKAPLPLSTLVYPLNGTTLMKSKMMFQRTATVPGATYKLIVNSGGTITSYAMPNQWVYANITLNGQPAYVKLITTINGVDQPSKDYTFNTKTVPPHIPAILSYDAEGNNAGKIAVDAIKLEGTNHLYSERGYKNVQASDFIAVDPTKSYTIKGQFKSTGVADSKLYFGIATYDQDKNEIRDRDVLRASTRGVITSFGDSKIVISTAPTDWYGAGSMAYTRSLGFYFDGDTNKLPDYVYYIKSDSTDPSLGAYRDVTGNQINLNAPLPPEVSARIIPGVTVVMNHYTGSTYLYSAAANVTVPRGLTTYQSGAITGEGFGNNYLKFRQGTRYVKPLFLLNYGDTELETQETVFDNVRFDEILPKVPATMISPTLGTTLTSSTQTLTWNPGTNATSYSIKVKMRTATFQQNVGTNTSVTVSNLPLDGNDIFVTITTTFYDQTVLNKSYFYTMFNSWTAAPTNLTATPVGSSSIKLTWTDNATNETVYYVQRAPGGGSFLTIAELGINATSYTDSGLTSNTNYQYRVRAFNPNAGPCPYSNIISATTSGVVTAPAAPTNLSASALSSSQIGLVWTDNATSETGYYVERGPSGTGPFNRIAALGANAVNYVDNGLSAGTSYYYLVRAYNDGGNPQSNLATTTTLSSVPAAPTNLTATATSSSSIKLAWTDNATNETGYYVERAVSSGSFFTVAELGINAASYTDNGLTGSTTYRYRVRAFNPNAGPYSNEVSAITMSAVTPPASPNGLMALLYPSNQVMLRWQDNSNNETNFRLERSTSPTSGYVTVTTLGANATWYLDTGTGAHTTYFYRIWAYNSAGDSAPTSGAMVTTA